MGQVFTPEELQDWLASKRQADPDTVMVTTNGCFDLLHVGHLRYLKAAREQGDFLILALNSDASIRRLKGSARPVVPEAERAELLSSLVCVDAVVLFDEDTPVDLLKAIRPEVHVKGDQYTSETLPEAPDLMALGTRLAFVPMETGHSTSLLIERILERYAAQSA